MKQEIKKLILNQETLQILNHSKPPKPGVTQTACGTCSPLLCE